ncbi:hypothetical protein [Maridesulfovibrio sp.]|uniref:hypothetical protein n=1 Tax=Maridesulfovibrio sp. TaxID=2795000 RepID=UPI0029CA8221|nr:hypothetical protein [Maridesulfovibrio sp.]
MRYLKSKKTVGGLFIVCLICLLVFGSTNEGQCADYVFYVDASGWSFSKAEQISEHMVGILKKDQSSSVQAEIRYVFNDCTSGFCIPHIRQFDSQVTKYKIRPRSIEKNAFLDDIQDIAARGGGFSNLETYKCLLSDVLKAGQDNKTTVVVYNRFVCFTGNVKNLKERFINHNTYFQDLFSRFGSNVDIWKGYKDYVVRANECKVLTKFCWDEREPDSVPDINQLKTVVSDHSQMAEGDSEKPVVAELGRQDASVTEPVQQNPGTERPEELEKPEKPILKLKCSGFSKDALGVDVTGFISDGVLNLRLFIPEGTEISHQYAVQYSSSSPRTCAIGSYVRFAYTHNEHHFKVIKKYSRDHLSDFFNVKFVVEGENG